MTNASPAARSIDDTASVNWHHWLERWDIQQTGYLPERETRFNVMFDVLDILLPESFVAIDLACGPGAISQRLLTRFPKARCIAVDLDPILLTMGQHVLGNMDGRLTWVEADLTTPEWLAQLRVDTVDTVLSTTALHWLPAPNLVTLYRQLGQMVRPGGVFLNGDHMSFEPRLERFQHIANAIKERIRDEAFNQRGVEDWEQWWEALAQEPTLDGLLAKREQRFASQRQTLSAVSYRPTFALHEAALREAGFEHVDTIWQRLDNRVLMAIR
ncbi:16S rRNA (cytosine(1402)-N(4))-methyltransferase [Candidatus Entotheonella serta]|nr:16S rRNA (cytosine(1402)-N(4))-methyltransferase [Candidatus Entotheonella serta]